MLACQFVGRKVKPEKPLRSSSPSRPVNTARGSCDYAAADGRDIVPGSRAGRRMVERALAGRLVGSCLKLDDPAPRGHGHRMGPVGDAQLGEDALEVGLHRLLGER